MRDAQEESDKEKKQKNKQVPSSKGKEFNQRNKRVSLWLVCRISV